VLLPITIIRFAVLYPIICYWIAAEKHKNLIERHVELHNGTYTAILTGEKIGAKWAYHASMWTFAASVPSLIFLPPLNLPFAVVDTIITVHISIATHYQTGFNPHRKADCRDVRYLPRPAGVNENFFEAAARLDGKEKWDSRYLCIEFVEQWRYGIALSSVNPKATKFMLTSLAFSAHAYRLSELFLSYAPSATRKSRAKTSLVC
jgi:hypothetical protein